MIKYPRLFAFILFSFCFYAIILNKNELNKDQREMNLIQNKDDEKYIKKIESLCNNAATTIIVGSGPAAQAAAIYCARLGGRPLVIAGMDGGQLEYTGVVENIPYVINKKGKEVVEIGIQQAKNFGAVFVHEVVTKIIADEYPYKVITDKNVYYGFSVILAMGSHIKKLECPGAQEYWGKGISSCAVCDAPFYKNKKVVIVGGGDTACEEALQLSFYADEILIFVRKDAMKASKAMQDKLKDHNKIKVVYNTEIVGIIGTGERVTKVIVRSNNEKKELEVDGVFIAIGQYPNTELVKDFIAINQDTRALVYEERSQKLSKPGFFGAGEVGDVIYKQAGIATGEGIKAALDCFDFLSKQTIDEQFIKNYDRIWVTASCQNGVCVLKEPLVKKKEKSLKALSYKKELKSVLNEFRDEYFLLDFTAPWCSGCRVLKKTLEEYIKQDEALRVFTVNVDEIETGSVPFLKPQIQIRSIPLLLLMKGNQVIARNVGSMNLQELKAWVMKNMK